MAKEDQLRELTQIKQLLAQLLMLQRQEMVSDSRRRTPGVAAAHALKEAHRGPGRPREGGDSIAGRAAVVIRRGAQAGVEREVGGAARDVSGAATGAFLSSSGVRNILLGTGAAVGLGGAAVAGGATRSAAFQRFFPRTASAINTAGSASAGLASLTRGISGAVGGLKGLGVAAAALAAGFVAVKLTKSRGREINDSLVAFKSQIADLTVKGGKLGAQILAQQQQYENASPAIARVFAQFRASEQASKFAVGERTAASTGALARAMADLRNTVRMRGGVITNLLAPLGTLMVGATATIAKLVALIAGILASPFLFALRPAMALLEAMNNAIEKLNQRLDKILGFDLPDVPIERFLEGVAKGDIGPKAVKRPKPGVNGAS